MKNKQVIMGEDGSGQQYFDVDNIRITVVENTWDDVPGIRVQAYKENGQLNPGAELPIANSETAFRLILALTNASSKALEIKEEIKK